MQHESVVRSEIPNPTKKVTLIERIPDEIPEIKLSNKNEQLLDELQEKWDATVVITGGFPRDRYFEIYFDETLKTSEKNKIISNDIDIFIIGSKDKFENGKKSIYSRLISEGFEKTSTKYRRFGIIDNNQTIQVTVVCQNESQQTPYDAMQGILSNFDVTMNAIVFVRTRQRTGDYKFDTVIDLYNGRQHIQQKRFVPVVLAPEKLFLLLDEQINIKVILRISDFHVRFLGYGIDISLKEIMPCIIKLLPNLSNYKDDGELYRIFYKLFTSGYATEILSFITDKISILPYIFNFYSKYQQPFKQIVEYLDKIVELNRRSSKKISYEGLFSLLLWFGFFEASQHLLKNGSNEWTPWLEKSATTFLEKQAIKIQFFPKNDRKPAHVETIKAYWKKIIKDNNFKKDPSFLPFDVLLIQPHGEIILKNDDLSRNSCAFTGTSFIDKNSDALKNNETVLRNSADKQVEVLSSDTDDTASIDSIEENIGKESVPEDVRDEKNITPVITRKSYKSTSFDDIHTPNGDFPYGDKKTTQESTPVDDIPVFKKKKKRSLAKENITENLQESSEVNSAPAIQKPSRFWSFFGSTSQAEKQKAQTRKHVKKFFERRQELAKNPETLVEINKPQVKKKRLPKQEYKMWQEKWFEDFETLKNDILNDRKKRFESNDWMGKSAWNDNPADPDYPGWLTYVRFKYFIEAAKVAFCLELTHFVMSSFFGNPFSDESEARGYQIICFFGLTTTLMNSIYDNVTAKRHYRQEQAILDAIPGDIEDVKNGKEPTAVKSLLQGWK